MNYNELLQQAETYRSKLYELSKLYPLNDPKIVRMSQRLDTVILELQRRRYGA